MFFFYLFLVGILIGTAMVVPGLSGGVIAVVLGIYDKMIYSLNNLFRDFKKNFMFLLILSCGVLTGAIWFSNVLFFLYENHEVATKLSFIGLIIGGIPYLFKQSKGNNSNYFITLLTLLFSFMLCYLSTNVININLKNTNSLIWLFITGFVYSIGKVIPGISSSFLLIIINKYEFVLKLISHPISYGIKNISLVIPFTIGLTLGVILLLKIITRLLDKHYSKVYSVIVGFVLGSIPIVIPNLYISFELSIGIILLIIFSIISFKLTYK